MNKLRIILALGLLLTGCEPKSATETVSELPEMEDDFLAAGEIMGATPEESEVISLFGAELAEVLAVQTEPLTMEEFEKYVALLDELTKGGIELYDVQGDALDQLHEKLEVAVYEDEKLAADQVEVLDNFTK